MGKGGGKPIASLEDVVPSVLGEIETFAENPLRPMDEVIGEISGRNLQRQALNEQKKALYNEEKLAKKAKEDELKRLQVQDIAASAFAGAQRNQSYLGF